MVFDNHIQSILCIILADLSEINLFLLAYIRLVIYLKNSVSVGGVLHMHGTFSPSRRQQVRQLTRCQYITTRLVGKTKVTHPPSHQWGRETAQYSCLWKAVLKAGFYLRSGHHSLMMVWHWKKLLSRVCTGRTAWGSVCSPGVLQFKG